MSAAVVVDRQAIRNLAGTSAGGYRPLVYAVLLHVVVLILLSISLRWSEQSDGPAERVIQAVVVKEVPPAKPAPPPAPTVDPAEVERQAQQKRQAEAQVLREKQQQEAKRQAAEKKRQAAEQKRKQEAEERKKRDVAEATRRKQEAESLKKMLEAEERERAAQVQQARAAGLINEFKPLIRQKVTRNWIQPPGAVSGLQCVVLVRLVASGEVLQATVVRGSGNTVFDRSVENAVYKASPLPIPQDTDLFEYFREIEFTFKP